MALMHCDVFSEDLGISIDMDIPAIIVNHAVSEIYRLKLLADHLMKQYPSIPVHYIPQFYMYQLIQV